FFAVDPNTSTNLPPIVLGTVTPIPQTVTLTAASTSLAGPGSTAQLTVTARYFDGSIADLTNSPGTVYSTSNPGIATISSTGLITAVSGGSFVVRASNEGAAGLVFLQVAGVGNISGTVFHSDAVTPLPSARVSLYNNFPTGFVTTAIANS